MAKLLDFGGWPLDELLDQEVRQRLYSTANAVVYADGALIHGRGDHRPGLSIVQSGAVQFGQAGEDGFYITTSTLGPGHCFGEATLFASMPRAYDAVAVGETTVAQISKVQFDRIFDSEPALARALLIATTRRLYNALEFMDDLRRLPLIVRAAKLIANMAASAGGLCVECNQIDLAATLGVSRVSIGKALGDLQGEGYIQLGYGKIDIINDRRFTDWIAEQSE